MFRGSFNKSKHFHQESKVDQILWFVENYLPKKKKKKKKLAIRKGILMNNLGVNNIKKNQNLVFVVSKFLTITLNKNKILFSFGNWALPYLKILKRKRLLKQRSQAEILQLPFILLKIQLNIKNYNY